MSALNGKILAVVLAFASALGGVAWAEEAPPQCTAPEFRQMDFWLGEWDLSWEASPSMPAGRGVNTVTRALGDCAIEESFSGDETVGMLVGHSMSTFHVPSGQWRQTWVDNTGGYFALTGGVEGNRFVLTSTRLSERAPHLRMVFEEISSNSLTWRWQRSEDGSNWIDEWVIDYVRRS